MFHSTTKNTIQGFTLLEMLAVIAIIGILSSIVLANNSGARAKGRDAERITEVSQIALAAELFYNACRQYPSGIADPPGVTCAAKPSINLGMFMSSEPIDPTGGTYIYATDGDSFVIRAELEVNNSALTNDVDGSPHTVDCDDSPKFYYCKGN